MTNSLCIGGSPPKTAKDFTQIMVDMNTVQEVLGIVLIVGCIAAVLPQHFSIIRNKSTQGIAVLWLFLSQINQYSSFINALLLKFPQVKACTVLGIVKCSPSILTIYQLFGIWLFNFPLYWWMLYYTPKQPHLTSPRELRTIRATFGVFLGYAALTTITAILLLKVFGECHDAVVYFGWTMGLISTILTVVQWSPQIYQTWRQGSAGSFSLLMLCIQGPGSLIIVYFLIFVSKESITTWAAYLISAIEQFILLGLIFYFKIRDRVKGKKDNDEYRSTESEPLLFKEHK